MMDQHRVAVLSKDVEYLDEISSALAREIKRDVEIDLIDDDVYLHKFLATAQRVSILFIDADTVDAGSHHVIAKKICYLSGEPGGRAECINKYEGVRGLLKQIDSSLLRDVPHNDIASTQVIHVAGLCGGCGKTVISIGLSYALASKGRSVLYLNADSLQDYTHEMHCHQNDFANESLAIAIGQKGAVHTERFMEQLEKDDFYYPLPFRQAISNYGLSEERISEAAEILGKMNLYDDIVVEHPNGFADTTINALRGAEKVLLVGTQNQRAAERFERIVKGNMVNRNTCYLACNRFVDSETDDLTPAGERENIPVCEYIPETDDVTPMEMARNGRFRNLAEILVLKI